MLYPSFHPLHETILFLMTSLGFKDVFIISKVSWVVLTQLCANICGVLCYSICSFDPFCCVVSTKWKFWFWFCLCVQCLMMATDVWYIWCAHSDETVTMHMCSSWVLLVKMHWTVHLMASSAKATKWVFIALNLWP